jgi:hypothetical protein
MKTNHLNYYRTEASEAFKIAAALQWSDPALALEWHCYALECQRIADKIIHTPARDYVAMVVSAQQSQPAQLSMF